MSEPTFTPSEETNNVISKPTETEEKPGRLGIQIIDTVVEEVQGQEMVDEGPSRLLLRQDEA